MATSTDRPALDDAALAELGRLLNTYGDWCTLDGEAGARGDEAGMEAARQERAELRRAFFERLAAARAEVERLREERDERQRAIEKLAPSLQRLRRALVNLADRPYGVIRPKWLLRAIEQARAAESERQPTPADRGTPCR